MPGDVESRWQRRWRDEGVYCFTPGSGKRVFSLDTPPPFTSGTLHMGHIYNHTWIDIVARYKRMRGYMVYFPQGFDCHGLPTELKVEKELGVGAEDRKLFIQRCREWTDTAVERMRKQFESIGYSADWSYTYRTMDDSYMELVQKTLLEFYEKGILYRGKHPVMWCPSCGTALAKAEVGHVEEEGKLYYIDFTCGGHKLTIATTRPEMMPACVAVLVHPGDDRYKKFVGEKATLPLFGREVPILEDDAVDKDFGSGVVYLCTFGDEQDIIWQKKYNLPVVEAIDVDGCLTDVAGSYSGLSVEEARERITEDLVEDGHIRKIEKIMHSVLCHTERSSCRTPIEFLPLNQWFINVRDYIGDIVDAAEGMNWHPGYMLQRLVDWSESMGWDWIISRQRVFGTPIPFWVCKVCGGIVSARDVGLELPVDPRGSTQVCGRCGGEAVGVTDVCDCWVDSSVTPLVISRWGIDDEFFRETYPASVRPQGYEIIRTWAFYTIYRCLLLTGERCFVDLLVNGMVAGPDGRKMSKSLGNVIEPEEPLKKYSADTIRQWAAGGTLGEDYPFSWEVCEHSMRFLTKFWNVSRFIELHLRDFEEREGDAPLLGVMDKWILSKLQDLVTDCTQNLDDYVFNAPLSEVRAFIWHDLADNYMEFVKHRLYKPDLFGEESRYAAQYTLSRVLRTVLLLLSPFTPHICDEIWDSVVGGYASTSEWPQIDNGLRDKKAEEGGELAVEIVSEIRKYKSEQQIPLGSELEKVGLTIEKKLLSAVKEMEEDIKATGKIKELGITASDKVKRFEIRVHKQ